jgi:hypothetical protein
MKKLFQEMDLYKLIIILCALSLPLTGWWIYSLSNKIDAGKIALARATRQGAGRESGDLEAIGTLMQQVEKINRNKQSETGADAHRVHFQRQILETGSKGLKTDDFIIGEIREVQLTSEKAKDQEVSITFKKDGAGDKTALTREFLNAMLYNCEFQSIWKLRKLKISNKDSGPLYRSQKPPPPESGDDWFLEGLAFSKRVPLPK